MSARALAERYFFDDAPSALIKLRQLGEFIAKDVAAHHGLLPSNLVALEEVLRKLKLNSLLSREIADLFFHLKRLGNVAAHEDTGTTSQALTALKVARADAIWFHQSHAVAQMVRTLEAAGVIFVDENGQGPGGRKYTTAVGRFEIIDRLARSLNDKVSLC